MNEHMLEWANEEQAATIATLRAQVAAYRDALDQAKRENAFLTGQLSTEALAQADEEIARLMVENQALQSTIIDLRDRAGIACEDVISLRARIAELEALREWEPDWSKAPAWAQWWAMDADGYCYWYSAEPEQKQYMWSQGSGQGTPAGQYAMSDWRKTKRRRPQEAPTDG